MQFKEYMPLVALIVSISSLFFSVRASRFTSRTKSAEIRVTILSTAFDLLLSNSRLEKSVSALKIRASNNGHSEISEMLASFELDKMINEIQDLYDDIEKTPISSAIASYEAYFHKLHRMSERSKDLESDMARVEAMYEKYSAKQEA